MPMSYVCSCVVSAAAHIRCGHTMHSVRNRTLDYVYATRMRGGQRAAAQISLYGRVCVRGTSAYIASQMQWPRYDRLAPLAPPMPTAQPCLSSAGEHAQKLTSFVMVSSSAYGSSSPNPAEYSMDKKRISKGRHGQAHAPYRRQRLEEKTNQMTAEKTHSNKGNSA
jgi:hypothetical protein